MPPTDPVDERASRQKLTPFFWLALVLAAVAAIAALLIRRQRGERARRRPPRPQPLPPEAILDLEGLTEDEAAARRLEGQDNAILFKPPRSKQEIWRANVYTIFNLSLVGLAIVQLLFGKPLDALLSMGVMALNIAINTIQEMFARRRLQDIEQITRAQATVIREARVRSIDPGEIVRGDVLIAGPGDQILVDGQVRGAGQIAVDESMLTGDTQRQLRSARDTVYAGSFCLAGRAAYEAQKVGDERLIVALAGKTQAAKEELTPLERIIDRVLRVLLGIVALLTLVLVVQYLKLDTYIPADIFNDAASVIFGIAPASLFFMVLLSYAAGTADLGKLGALVHRARSVELLAQVNVVCFARAGILTGTHVEVDPVDPPPGQARLAGSRLQQILGDYARSTSADNLVIRAMIATFPGDRRAVQDEAPFLSVQGWNAITFDDDDLRGVYVLGEPQALKAYLVTVEDETVETESEDEPQPSVLRRAFAPLNHLFRRAEPQETPPAAEASLQDPDVSPADNVLAADEGVPPQEVARPNAFRRLRAGVNRALRRGEATPAAESPLTEEGAEGKTRPNVFQRLRAGVNRALRRGEAAPEEGEDKETKELVVKENVLLFAYYPELTVLHTAGGLPQLPGGLVPLCELRYTERMRPEAVETIQAFTEMGVDVKVFTPQAPEQTVDMLRQAGLDQDDGLPLQAISGPELDELPPRRLPEAAAEHSVFGHVNAEQTRQVVEALRREGQAVAVVGDRVNDLPALHQANLAIARQSSSQAALSVADIVVLEDSPKALLPVLDKGQRIVNGLLDVLKLYLVQIFYLLFLIVAIPLLADGFPYRSSQGSVVAIATVQIPSIALTLSAAAGILAGTDLRRRLTRFVGPAAITMGVAGLLVYLVFWQRTGQVAEAQIALIHALTAMGLLLVVFVKAPVRAWRRGEVQKGGWVIVVLALVLLVVFVALTYLPLAQELLRLAPLSQPTDYLDVAVITLIWAILVNVAWWLLPQERRAIASTSSG